MDRIELTTPVVSDPPPAESRHEWTLRRRLGTTFTIMSSLLVALIALVAVLITLSSHTSSAVIGRWQPSLTTSKQIDIDLVDQQSALRAFALDRKPGSVADYQAALTAERRDTQHLIALVGSDSVVQPRVAALMTSTAAWRSHVATPAIAAVQAGRPAAALLDSTASFGFDAVRARADALNSALTSRVDHTLKTRKTNRILFYCALGLLVLVVLTFGWLLWRGLHRWVLDPVDALAEQTRRVASGERQQPIAIDGAGEFIDLGSDVEDMRGQIERELTRVEQLVAELQLTAESLASSNLELADRSAELARSNDDLQQFAYVASHDLSEPLRKVANFCQLLERRYGPQLDDQARTYIGFAVDGAKRLQALIADLLALSRVGRSSDNFVQVDLNDGLDQAIANLGDHATGATIERSPLPTVRGDRALLVSLLENLVGNAIKYSRPGVTPLVRIGASTTDTTALDGDLWTFTIEDNGIGISSDYAERIFVVFQRLHTRDEYGGTGIGLALCRKIVEFHRGNIWLGESSLGGATFHFTLPANIRADKTTRAADLSPAV